MANKVALFGIQLKELFKKLSWRDHDAHNADNLFPTTNPMKIRFSIMLTRLTVILLSLNCIDQSQCSNLQNFLQPNIITDTKYFRE